MPIKIFMPALSPTMKKGKVVEWLKKEGDAIVQGDLLFKIETDKAVMEIESVDRGKIGKIIVPAGIEAEVNAVLALLLTKGESEADLAAVLRDCVSGEVAPSGQASTVQPNIANQPQHESQSQSNIKSEHIFISPLARRIAADNKIDLTNVLGSSTNGRIVKQDVLGLMAQNNAVPQNTNKPPLLKNEPHTVAGSTNSNVVVEPSDVQKIIAERLTKSKQEIPHFYLTMDCMMDELLSMRAKLNSNIADNAQKITVNDMVTRAVALSLRHCPDINSSWQNHKIIQYSNVDVSIAVAVGNALITPIVRNADQRGFFGLSAEIKRLVKRAQDQALTLDEFQGGGFTISNLGMFGIKEFKAIINPPQAAILAIGSAEKRPVVVDNTLSIGSVTTLSLSVDHRLIQGVAAANFLKKLRYFIENPYKMID